ncbi:MAG: glycosyltransferase [Chitinophagaceae bacterium]|jgi:glycosyltransferase|nr:glycosyltransferase [Chitinophagaceae bacterium]
MKVSIITVCFNSAQTIEATFQSVLGQSYGNIEYLVVDGASTDGTQVLIQRYSHFISRWVSEPDGGLYDAMNKGLALATGDVIGILNSDDVYAHANVVEHVVAEMSRTNADCLYGDLEYVAPNDLQRVVRHWRAGRGGAKHFYWGWMPPHPTFFARKEVYQQCGNFDLRFPVASDYEFMLRAMVKMNCKTAYLPEIMVKMRMGGESNKSLRNRKRSYFENFEAWRVNGIRPYFFTIWFKILRKVFQFRWISPL